MITKNFILKGLHCPACKKLTEKRIRTIAGVASVTVDPNSGLAIVQSATEITSEQISKALENTAYTVSN